MTTPRDRSPVRAAIFDLGNVVVDFDRTRTYRAIAGKLGGDVRAIEDVLESSDLRKRYEVGAIETPAFRTELRAILGCDERHLPDGLLDESWSNIFQPRLDMVEVLKDLRSRGMPLLLLSNTNALHFDHVRSAYADILALFDEAVLSHEAGVAKPDPAIFHLALDKLRTTTPDLQAGDVIFIDDSGEHVAAAESLGLHGFTFRSHRQLIAWLRSQGIRFPN